MEKLIYKGAEVEEIKEGYWPDGIKLVFGDRKTFLRETELKVICLKNGIAFFSDGTISDQWQYWAILPPKPAPRRLTNREIAKLCIKGWQVRFDETIYQTTSYAFVLEDKPCNPRIKKLRAPNSDKWLEPTSDLLEVAQ